MTTGYSINILVKNINYKNIRIASYLKDNCLILEPILIINRVMPQKSKDKPNITQHKILRKI